MESDGAVSLLVDVHVAETAVLHMGLLKLVKLQPGVLTHTSLDNLRHKEITVIGCVVAEQHAGLRIFLQHDEHAPVRHQVDIRTHDVHHLYGALHRHVARHIDKESVLS